MAARTERWMDGSDDERYGSGMRWSGGAVVDGGDMAIAEQRAEGC